MSAERILVVDDDPAILALCERILTADGYSVAEAKRGEEALTKLEAQPFDLLLTDIRLPGLNGLEVTERLRARGVEMTIITMTGYSNMDMAIQALSLGVDEFLIKPFTLDSLRITVSKALEKSYLRRENTRLRALVPLLQTSEKLMVSRTRDQVYEHLLNATCDIFETGDAMFLDASRDGQVLTVAAARGFLAPLSDSIMYPSQIKQVEDLTSQVQVWNERAAHRLPVLMERLAHLVSAPLSARERTLGIIIGAVQTPPSQSNLDMFNLIVAHAAATLENVDLLSDISRAYVNARELDHLKSEFINIAGHELRTPLAVLHGYAMLLRDKLTGEYQGYATEVVTQAERLQNVANDMLNLQKLNEGSAELRLTACQIDQVVREVVSAYRTLALERGQTIELDVAPEVGSVQADRAMLDLMLGSLLSNAIKFSPRNTRVRIAAEGDQDQIVVRVQDEGKGLEAAQIEHIFEPFYQASHSLTRSEGGLGLGLTLADKMARAHGGKIWVESQVERGSCFYISLPRRPPDSVRLS